ncbi:MAG: hypothetical protein AAGJ10_05485 [Bacteroidota bacterium]
MKNIIFGALSVIALTSCNPKQEDNKEDVVERFVEEESPFTNLLDFKVIDNEWIREPENIITVHETLKNGFYQSYLTPEILDRNPLVRGDFYYKTALRVKIDSLVKTYPDYKSANKYYREFWTRRKEESNDSIVFHVLTEIHQIVNGESPEVNEDLIDGQLFEMLSIRTAWLDFMDSETAISHFAFLKKEKMHQSAYNLLFENYFYSDLNLDKDSLKLLLQTETVSTDTVGQRSIFVGDNTK